MIWFDLNQILLCFSLMQPSLDLMWSAKKKCGLIFTKCQVIISSEITVQIYRIQELSQIGVFWIKIKHAWWNS